MAGSDDDVRRIEQLKYAYLRTLDTKDWDGFAACFVEDVTADYAGLRLDGRDALVSYLREHLGPDVITLHQVHHPEIEVAGDTATGRWYLQDTVIAAEHRFRLDGAAFYEDDYVRVGDRWLVSHTGYRRTFELTSALDESVTVKGPQG